MEIIAPVAIADDMPGYLSRSTPGTYWDRFGVMQTAPPNVLRITYDPKDLSAPPYALMEYQGTNLLTTTNSLSGTYWGLSGGNVQDGVSVGPDGLGGASRWDLSGLNQGRFTTVSNLIVGSPYTLSVFYKYVGGSGSFLVGAENVGAGYVDLPTGDVFAADGNASCVVDKHASGWRRIRVTFIAPASTATLLFYSRDSTEVIFDIFGAQLEIDVGTTSYTPATSKPGFRATDMLPTGVRGIVYSTITESDSNDAPLWLGSTAYATASRVRRPNHRMYLALQDVPNTAGVPENNTSGKTPYWQDVGPTERFAIFDNKYSTYAAAPETLSYVLRPGSICTALAALGIDGSDVRVSVVDIASGVLVYQNTKNLRIKNCTSLLDYFFKPIIRRRDEVFDDLPRFKDTLICLTITKPGSIAQLSDVVVGRLEYVGEAQWEPEIRTLRRSIIEDDGFGAIKFTKRRSSKLLTASVRVDNALADNVVRIMDEYTDEPCVIVVDSRWTSLIILGFVQDFSFVLKSPAGSLYNAQAQGFA